MLKYFENFNAFAGMMDFFWAALLLVIAQLIRRKIKLFQNWHIPASVIAGLAGLVLGPNVLNVIAFSDQAGSYSGVLIIMIFSTLLLGYTEKTGNFKSTIWNVRDTFFNNWVWGLFQFSLSILVGWFLSNTFLPNVFEGAGILLTGGFYGGYGYGTTMGGILETYGMEGGIALGCTFATIGMFAGILFGMININIGMKKGYLRFAKKAADSEEKNSCGMLDGEEQFSIGRATTHPSAMDPLGWHLCLVLVATGGGWLISYYVKKLTDVYLPELCMSMLFALLLQKTMNAAKIGHYVDKQTVNRIGSTITDFLVFFGLSTISIQVVLQYWQFIVILSVLGVAINMFYFWYIAPRTYLNNWFERAILTFGTYTGVMATGATLLRVVDPDNESNALRDTGISASVFGFCDSLQVAFYPAFCGAGYSLVTGLAIGAAIIVMLLIMKSVGCFHKSAKKPYV